MCYIYDGNIGAYETDVLCRYTLVDCQNACIRRQIAATCNCIDNQIATAEHPDLPDRNPRGQSRNCLDLALHRHDHIFLEIVFEKSDCLNGRIAVTSQ